MSQPLVSVVIPSYRHAAFLCEAIDSVLAQSHADLELIIIDDASPDDSWALIQGYDDPRIHAHRHTGNQGAHQTLNEGLDRARGEWLTILNSDDRYHPTRLEHLLAAARATPAGLLATRVELIGERDADWLAHYERLLAVHAENDDLLTALCAGNLLITTSNFFFHRDLYRRLGGFADLRYVHDYDFALRAAMTEQGARLIDEPLLDYRLHAANTISEQPIAAIGESVDLLEHHAGAIQRHARQAAALPLLAAQMREQMRWLEGEYKHRIYLKDQALAKQEDLRAAQAAAHARAERTLRQALAAAHRAEATCKQSRSYRLGYQLLRPARWLRGLRQRPGAARGDERITALEALRPLIMQRRASLLAVSFDIFDTLLARHIEPPEAVQYAVCRELAEQIEGQDADAVWRTRIETERTLREIARRDGGDGECHFDELAHRWAAALAASSGGEAKRIETLIHATEMAMERRALYAKPGARELLAWLREQGLAVIATSDMYLGQRHVTELLEANGLLERLDAVHVSSETGLCKHSGRLFDFLLREHGWRPEQVLHIGDNPWSDHAAARQRGIQAVWLRERDELRRRARQRAAWALRERGAIWPGHEFFSILENHPPPPPADFEHAFFHAYGRERLGPVFLTFMAGLIERLRAQTVGKVFFVARDGYLFHQLYRQRPDADSLPPADYLYASRRAIAAAAIAGGLRPAQAGVALLNPKQQGLLSILKTFALEPDAYRDAARRHGFDDIAEPLTTDDPRLRAFLDDREVQARLRDAGRRARDLLEGYLEQTGFFGHDAVALVDIGWNGTIQRFLRDAFGHRDDFPALHGYYFAFVGEIHVADPRDRSEGLLFDARRDPPAWRAVAEFEELFEQGARSPEATTLGYREHAGRIEPILKSDDAIDRRQELASNPMIAALQQGVLSLQNDFLATQALTGCDFTALLPYARALVERMVIHPTREEVAQITRLSHSEDFGHDHTLDLRGAPLRLRELLHPRALATRLALAPWQAALFTRLPGRALWILAFRWLKLRRHNDRNTSR